MKKQRLESLLFALTCVCLAAKRNEILAPYMASTGRQYQSHAATIRRWAAEDMRRQLPQRDYSVKAGDTVRSK